MARIRVRRKDTGKIGTIEESEFASGNFERVGASQLAQPQQKKQSFFERFNLLPIAGGIAGAGLGAFGGPAGLIGGGAVGSGIGEFLEQLLTGKGNIKGIAAETALGGIGGGIGKLLGLGRAAAPAVRGGVQAAEQAGKGIVQTFGAGLRRSILKPQAGKGAFFTEGEASILSNLEKVGLGGSPRSIAEGLPNTIRGITNQAKNLVKSAKGRPFSGDALRERLTKGASGITEFNQFSKSQASLLNSEISDLISKTGGRLDKILDFKLNLGRDISRVFSKLSGDIAGDLTEKEAAKYALWKQLDSIVTSRVPGAKELTSTVSALMKAAPGLQKAGATGVQIPLPLAGRIRLPDIVGRPLQGAGEAIGRRLESGAIPQIASFAGRAARAGVAQSIPRLVTGPGGEEELVPGFDREDIDKQLGLGTDRDKLGISQFDISTTSDAPESQFPAEMAALMIAQNPKQASAIMQIYKLLNPEPKGGKVPVEFFKELKSVNEGKFMIEQFFADFLTFKGRGPIAGRIAGPLGKLTGGAIFGAEKAYDDLRQVMASRIAKGISAETGRLTDQDIERAYAALPRLSDSDGTAKIKLEKLRNQIEQRENTITEMIQQIQSGAFIPGGSFAQQQNTNPLEDLLGIGAF